MDDETVERHCRQFWQRLDLHLLTWPDAKLLEREDVQQRILESVNWVLEAGSKTNVDVVYVRAYLKQLLARINGPEPLDALYDIYSQVLGQLQRSTAVYGVGSALPDGKYHASGYVLPDTSPAERYSPCIQLLEKPSVLSGAGCTGHRTWEASLSLGTELSQAWLHPHIVEKTVLELGCGTGLVSLACVLYGAKQALATDGDAAAIARLEETLELQTTPATGVLARQLFWGDETAMRALPVALEQIDTVLAADVTYDPSVVGSLAETLELLLMKNRSVFVLVVATARNLETLEAFEKSCNQRGLKTETVMRALPGPLHEQRGFFHVAESPIHYVRITSR